MRQENILTHSLQSDWRDLSLVPLAVGLSNVITAANNEILVLVVMTAREVALENSLGALSVTDLCVDRGTRHVRNHGVATAPWALHVAEWVVLGGGLGIPDITTIASQVARLDSFSNILLNDNSTTGSVNEP